MARWDGTYTPDLQRLEDEAGPFLARHPIENSAPRTICGTLRRHGPHAYGDLADLADPVSTGLYRRLGYVPVRDHVTLSFTDPDPSSPRNPCGTRDTAPSGARGGPGAAA
jgi:hypothetical protein